MFGVEAMTSTEGKGPVWGCVVPIVLVIVTIGMQMLGKNMITSETRLRRAGEAGVGGEVAGGGEASLVKARG
ncbi:hypothetical protein ACFWP3_10910 [Streptomyces sp. NPDC058525]|uniref:hypothetical protein n=1 Tax=Streptomyces sp. NPDC058525 TaxID=3346538 RepID=UPI00365628FD